MKKHLIAIMTLAIIMILLPIHLRTAQDNTTMPGIETYYHTKMAKQIAQLNLEDDRISTGREYKLNPYHILLAGIYAILGETGFTITQILLALLSILLLKILLTQLNIDENTQNWILLAYALSPALITMGTLTTPGAFALNTLLAGTILLLKNKPIGIIFIIITALTGNAYAIATIITLLIILNKTNKKQTIPTLIVTILLLITKTYPPTIPQELQYFTDFGATNGYSLFAFLLAIVGTILIWHTKQKHYTTYLLTGLLILLSFYQTELITITNAITSILAGIALATLAQRKWELHYLRNASLLVLFCGLLFSGISHAVQIAESEPTNEFFEAIKIPPTTIITHQNYGFWIETAGHTAITDPLWQEQNEPEDTTWDAQAIMESTNEDETQKILNKYNITHALITKEMQHGLQWQREEQGLDFLAKNSDNFKRIYKGNQTILWKIKTI